MRLIDFNQIYNKNYNRSYLFAKSYVHDDMGAEDIAVESLFKYWQVLKSSGEDIPEALLVTIIKNKCIDYLRREASRQAAIEDLGELSKRDIEIRVSSLESCNPSELFSEEIQRIISETLQKMPEQTRQVFILSRYENKSIKEISVEMGIAPKTVEYHISKSLKALRISLKDYLPILLTAGYIIY